MCEYFFLIHARDAPFLDEPRYGYITGKVVDRFFFFFPAAIGGAVCDIRLGDWVITGIVLSNLYSPFKGQGQMLGRGDDGRLRLVKVPDKCKLGFDEKASLVCTGVTVLNLLYGYVPAVLFQVIWLHYCYYQFVDVIYCGARNWWRMNPVCKTTRLFTYRLREAIHASSSLCLSSAARISWARSCWRTSFPDVPLLSLFCFSATAADHAADTIEKAE